MIYKNDILVGVSGLSKFADHLILMIKYGVLNFMPVINYCLRSCFRGGARHSAIFYV